MRKSAALGGALAILLAPPASAERPVAATWAGTSYEICPLAENWPCSYTGESVACEGLTAPGDTVTCTTTLTGATHTDYATAGTLTYEDELGTAYSIQVVLRDGRYSGTLTTAEGTVAVTGTLHPFAGTLTRRA